MPWVASGVAQLCLMNLSAMFHSDITGGVSLSIKPLQSRATMLFLSRCFSLSAVDGTDLPSRWLGIETLSISPFTTASFQTAALDLLAPLGTMCETLGPHWCLHCRFLPCKPGMVIPVHLSSQAWLFIRFAVHALCSPSSFLYVSSLLLCV